MWTQNNSFFSTKPTQEKKTVTKVSEKRSMSSLYESFNIMQVDEETKQIVSSYMSHCQHKFLSNNQLLRIIPELVTHICILYYYRTHSIYEWQVSDNPQLTNIKNAVPGQSFNHHFKLHKLDWFLKVKYQAIYYIHSRCNLFVYITNMNHIPNIYTVLSKRYKTI